MADIIHVGRSIQDLTTSPKLAPVSAVRMLVDESSYYEAGTSGGYEFEIESPWATQAQTNWLLSQMSGLEYSPYEAKMGLLPPQAELGDYANIRGVFGGILSEDISFGMDYAASFGSPADEEIDHEYKYESRTDRQLSQKVSRRSPKGNSEFGWSLQDDQWKIYNEDGDIFRVSATGAWLKGHLDITEGSININNTFTVDADGNLYATSGTFAGNVWASNIQYTDSDDPSTVNYGTFNGAGLSGGTVSKGKTTSSVQSTLTQVGINQSDIAAINAMFVGTLTCNAVTIEHAFKLGSLNISTTTVGGVSNVLYGYA